MQKIKNFIKNSPFLLKIYKTFGAPIVFRYRTNAIFNFDKKRFCKYALNEKIMDTRIFKITMYYHGIEKGLTMPNFRLGFGSADVKSLIFQLNEFINEFGVSSRAITDATGVLSEYVKVHDEHNFQIDPQIVEEVKKLQGKTNSIASKQIETTKSEYFSKINEDFKTFSFSRHSVRNFCGEISKEQILKSVEIANNAPSACNRQPCKVHLISNKETIKQLLSLQSGNRGFGNSTDKLLVLTVNQSSICWMYERNDLYLNAGIYLMNLLYALHYNKVACCTLNWSVTPKEEEKIHELLNLNGNENVTVLVACGDVPDNFKLANSPRKGIDEVLVVH